MIREPNVSFYFSVMNCDEHQPDTTNRRETPRGKERDSQRHQEWHQSAKTDGSERFS